MLNPVSDPGFNLDPIRIQTKFFMTKFSRNLSKEIFFLSKTVLHVFLNPSKDVQALQIWKLLIFSFLGGTNFWPAWIRIPDLDPLSHLNADTDPKHWLKSFQLKLRYITYGTRSC
jgi:hypothetical protein